MHELSSSGGRLPLPRLVIRLFEVFSPRALLKSRP
jgi:hypothetical protein